MAGIIARDRELADLDRFLDTVQDGPRALTFEGPAGIGKTALWEIGIAAARQRGYVVLECRPVEAEVRLSFAGVADLLDGRLDDILPSLPEPQREAMEVALLRRSTSFAADPRTVSVALLSSFRVLASRAPVLIAVDDRQWLDEPSGAALGFAVRRLHDEPIGILTAKRSGAGVLGSDTARTLDLSTSTISVGSLDALAMWHVIATHFTTSLPASMVRRICDVTAGNPYFALEIARAVLEEGLVLDADGTLPIPTDLRDLLRRRLAPLSMDARELLTLASALSRPTVTLLCSAMGEQVASACLQETTKADLIQVEGDSVRFSHPLLASLVLADAIPEQRRKVHRRVSRFVDDVEEHARHLALGTEGPNEQVAHALTGAAAHAHRRGTPAVAAELYELAARSIPSGKPDHVRELQMHAAEELFLDGDDDRAAEIMRTVIDSSPRGSVRGERLLQLGRVLFFEDVGEAARVLVGALSEELDPELESATHALLAWCAAYGGELREAEQHARLALQLAEQAGNDWALVEALVAVGTMTTWLGHGVPLELFERARSLEASVQMWSLSDGPTFGLAGVLRNSDPQQARAMFESLLGVATDLGDEHSVSLIHWNLAALAYLAGDLQRSWAHTDEALTRAAKGGDLPIHALLEGCAGDIEKARERARRMLDGLEGAPLQQIEAREALGFLALSDGDAEGAARELLPAWEAMRSCGIGEPSMFQVPADLAEALILLGRISDAEPIVEWLRERGAELDRPWAIGAAARCRGLILAARGDSKAGAAVLEEGVQSHVRAGMPFELARTLLSLGAVRRRGKQKAGAREALERALAIFDSLPTPVWGQKARAELARVSGRRSTVGELTRAEERVARLAAAGRTNREIAETLFISVRTAEHHLSQIYRKLGVRSRTELATQFDAIASSLPPTS
jgi:DNA-binding NarL/FixJ family response regulator